MIAGDRPAHPDKDISKTPQVSPASRPARRPQGLRLAALVAGLAFAGLAAAQVLEIAADGSPAGLDPHVVPAFNTVLVNKNIYEGLTAIDKDL